MADFTTIADSELAEGQPVKSITAIAIRDNPIAIAEGAAGAPRIVFDALADPVAGSTHIVWMSDVDGNSITQSPVSGSYSVLAATSAIRKSGTVRASIESCRSDSGQSSFCRVSLNGATVQTFNNTTTTPTFTTFVVDIAVAPGDIISFSHAADDASGPPISRNPRLYSDINTIITY